MTPEYWVGQGVMGVLLAAIGLAIWRIVLWGRVNVVIPVVAAHLALIDSLKTHLPKQTAAIDKQTEEIDKQTAEIKKQTEFMDADRKGILQTLLEKQNFLLDELKRITSGTHSLVNSKHAYILKLDAVMARRIAIMTNDPLDLDAAMLAEKVYAEHEEKQPIVDAAK